MPTLSPLRPCPRGGQREGCREVGLIQVSSALPADGWRPVEPTLTMERRAVARQAVEFLEGCSYDSRTPDRAVLAPPALTDR
jgi:hypothetical protein